MKNQIISVSCMIAVIVFLILSLALTVIFLLLCIKHLHKTGITEKEKH